MNNGHVSGNSFGIKGFLLFYENVLRTLTPKADMEKSGRQTYEDNRF